MNEKPHTITRTVRTTFLLADIEDGTLITESAQVWRQGINENVDAFIERVTYELSAWFKQT